MKVEGIEIEWWDREKFKGRKIEIFSAPDCNEIIDIPDDEILCDCCNSEITEFPVVVWDGRAYCKKCYQEYLEPNIET